MPIVLWNWRKKKPENNYLNQNTEFYFQNVTIESLSEIINFALLIMNNIPQQ